MRRKPIQFDTLAEYNAYFQGLKNGFIVGILVSITTASIINLVLRWLRIW